MIERPHSTPLCVHAGRRGGEIELFVGGSECRARVVLSDAEALDLAHQLSSAAQEVRRPINSAGYDSGVVPLPPMSRAAAEAWRAFFAALRGRAGRWFVQSAVAASDRAARRMLKGRTWSLPKRRRSGGRQ